jgi:cyclopropane fatty-acyl-phospholipid synthase-like methyltransferase
MSGLSYRTFVLSKDVSIAIVSIGMFEHVGVNHYWAYFQKLQSLLADKGVALLHFIGRSDSPTVTNPFIAKYTFPRGYIPALSEVLPAIERSGLVVTDVEGLIPANLMSDSCCGPAIPNGAKP